MAYMTQEHKKIIQDLLVTVLPKSEKWGFTLSVRNHTTLILTIRKVPKSFYDSVTSGLQEIINNSDIESSNYKLASFYQKRFSDGYVTGANNLGESIKDAVPEVVEKFKMILMALNHKNFDHSDSMTDYHHQGFFSELVFGVYGKPFEVVE